MNGRDIFTSSHLSEVEKRHATHPGAGIGMIVIVHSHKKLCIKGFVEIISLLPELLASLNLICTFSKN